MLCVLYSAISATLCTFGLVILQFFDRNLKSAKFGRFMITQGQMCYHQEPAKSLPTLGVLAPSDFHLIRSMEHLFGYSNLKASIKTPFSLGS